MSYTTQQIQQVSSQLAEAIKYPNEPVRLINAAQPLLAFQAALFVINRSFASPLYLCDTYPDVEAKQAVQRYIDTTYLINPVYNSFLEGLDTGLYRMRDIAPDAWLEPNNDHVEEVKIDDGEEIGYLTKGWPARQEELVLTSRVSDTLMVEISFAKAYSSGGFSDDDITKFAPFVPLFALAMKTVCDSTESQLLNQQDLSIQLNQFASNSLTARENQVIQLILKGHSGKSICDELDISMPTLKSHRRNAYTKLGISNQRELFSCFLNWKESLAKSPNSAKV